MYQFIAQNQATFAGFFFLLAVASLFAAAFFALMMRKTEKKADLRLKQARADITDMTILFQTMRDIIGQQKALARDFNEELEHKMEQVKHVLHQGMEKNRQLHEKQQRIVAELEEAQAQIDAIYRQLAQARPPQEVSAERTRPAAAPANTERPAPPRPAPRKTSPAGLPTEPRATSLPKESVPASIGATPVPPGDARDLPLPPRPATPRSTATNDPAASGLTPAAAARLAATGLTKSPFTSWIAEDLLTPESGAAAPGGSRQPEPEPEPEPVAPRNGDAAREAFRALLNMPAPAATPVKAPLEAPQEAPLDVLPRRAIAPVSTPEPPLPDPQVPLQQRVLEYSEAGMTVAQVSRELGIGKGEVRLMLSLAKQQNAPRA